MIAIVGAGSVGDVLMATLHRGTGVHRAHLERIVKVEIQLLVIEFAWLCPGHGACLTSRSCLGPRRLRLRLGLLLAARRYRCQCANQDRHHRRRKTVANSPEGLAPSYGLNWVHAGYF